MASRKTKDPDLSIIERVLAEPVPNKGDLANPFARKGAGARQMSIRDVEKAMRFPEDTDQWSLKTLVDYFEHRFKEATGGNYRGLYKSDCPSFQKYCKVFASQGLSRYFWCKALVDWAIEHRADIAHRHKHLTVQTLELVINEFIQEEVMPLVEEEKIERTAAPDEPFLDEIAESCLALRRLEVFARFGIPVAATYYARAKGMAEDRLMEGLGTALDAALTSLEGKAIAERMARNSIAGSPYPQGGMAALDWRDRLPELKKRYGSQRWWRDEDFQGRPLPKYGELTKGA